jgi:hypothetical protein
MTAAAGMGLPMRNVADLSLPCPARQGWVSIKRWNSPRLPTLAKLMASNSWCIVLRIMFIPGAIAPVSKD